MPHTECVGVTEEQFKQEYPWGSITGPVWLKHKALHSVKLKNNMKNILIKETLERNI